MYALVIIIALALSCECNDAFEDLMGMHTKIGPRRHKGEKGHNKDSEAHNNARILPKYSRPKNPNLNNTFFCNIRNSYQSKAQNIKVSDYPWVARVIHSPSGLSPLLCTAVALQKEIFLTAAQCIILAKVSYSSVIYQNKRLHPKAFVVPTNHTKQMFDDIGFVVVHQSSPGPNWTYINVLKSLRTDTTFDWFEYLHQGDATQTVIGFIHEPGFKNKHPLYMLTHVFMSNHLCNRINGMVPDSDDYWVPCYHHCTVEEHFDKNKDMCEPYLVGVGHAVLDKHSTLIGVATWACEINCSKYKHYRRLPVGIAVPNSEVYYKDLNCAVNIRDSDKSNYRPGYYKALCASNTTE